MRVLITRPGEDAEPLARRLAELGVESLIEPLLEIVYHDGPPVVLAGVRALLATSANGLRAFARRNRERHLPVFAVGDASAGTATALGFAEVTAAGGDVRALAELVGRSLRPGEGALLHVAARDLAGDLAGLLGSLGFHYRREVLYGARAAERLTAATAAALGAGTLDAVLVFSPRTAHALSSMLRASGLAGTCDRLAVFCLSQAVANALGDVPWRRVEIAPEPTQQALLDRLRRVLAEGENPFPGTSIAR